MAFDWATTIVTLAAGAAIPAAGFYGKRWITGESRREKLTDLRNKVDIAATLKERGLMMEEVENIETLISSREKTSATPKIFPIKLSPYWTQAAMNQRAADAAGTADRQLEGTLREMSTILRPDEQPLFDQAQAAWEAFRDRQAAFAGAECAGGSIVPLIFSAEREAVTLQRVKGLQATIARRTSLS